MNIQPVSSSLPSQGGAEVVSLSRETRAAAAPIAQGTTATAQQSQPPASMEQLEKAIDSVREYIKPFNSDLQFSVNDDTNKVIVTVVDSETKEVIRQIPSEEMLAIAKALDSIKGLFVKQQA